ncbi:hypothetical protein M513_07278 [Trichuris suis]|uniref:Uncharacterized protein n=1 Tax=Trichuris suis TaxID=68888 RepID=A0A085M403_9BILA|nr:hypothetical protein M513_07278 [Trichuris suis]
MSSLLCTARPRRAHADCGNPLGTGEAVKQAPVRHAQERAGLVPVRVHVAPEATSHKDPFEKILEDIATSWAPL